MLLVATIVADASADAGASDQKAVPITGASSGIGRYTTELLAENGYFVYASDHREQGEDQQYQLDFGSADLTRRGKRRIGGLAPGGTPKEAANHQADPGGISGGSRSSSRAGALSCRSLMLRSARANPSPFQV